MCVSCIIKNEVFAVLGNDCIVILSNVNKPLNYSSSLLHVVGCCLSSISLTVQRIAFQPVIGKIFTPDVTQLTVYMSDKHRTNGRLTLTLTLVHLPSSLMHC